MLSPLSSAAAGLPELLPVLRRDKTGAEFRVRAFRSEDRTALEAFYVDFEPKRAAQGLPPLGRERIARWLDKILPAGIHLLVEMKDVPDQSSLAGHALLIPTGQEPGVAEYAVFLHQNIRGRGIGTELNRISAEVARASGSHRLWLSVEPHNRAAIRSYEKVGYRFIPRTAFSPEAEMELVL